MRGKRRRGWDEGATAVEAAITFSVMLALIFGVVGFGFALWQSSTMMLAVEQAGRYVMINNASCNTSCAVSQMQTVLTTAASCTTPSADHAKPASPMIDAVRRLCSDASTASRSV